QKSQILEAYLNRIYLGDGHYGVEAAARGYFGKSAADLTLPDGALLAGLIKCPSACSPRVAPGAALARRNTVLAAMLRLGVIRDKEFIAAATAPIALRAEKFDPDDESRESGASGLYFLEAVRQEAIEKFGETAVLRGGLRIRTTIDMKIQREAENAI